MRFQNLIQFQQFAVGPLRCICFFSAHPAALISHSNKLEPYFCSLTCILLAVVGGDDGRRQSADSYDFVSFSVHTVS